jgi:hypothetical protein
LSRGKDVTTAVRLGDKTVKQAKNSAVRQASGLVTAAARQATAKEKARIAGKKGRKLSVLEQEAMEWEKEGEAKAGKGQGERLRISRQVEMCPFSFQQVQLGTDASGADDYAGWKPFSLRGEKRTATTVTGRVGIAKVCTLSRRLIAIERARALGRKPVDLRAWALELEARHWAEESARQK